MADLSKESVLAAIAAQKQHAVPQEKAFTTELVTLAKNALASVSDRVTQDMAVNGSGTKLRCSDVINGTIPERHKDKDTCINL